MTHFQEDDVLVWLLTDKRLPDRARAHAATCESCLHAVQKGEQSADAIRDSSAWEETPSKGGPVPVQETLIALETRLEEERSEGEDTVGMLSIEELEDHIGVTGGSFGLVQALVARSFAEVERNPDLGARYSGLAVMAAEMLRSADYGEILVYAARGEARRQRANALRMQGRLPEALEDLDRAEKAFMRTAVPDPEIASLQYIRASIYYTQGRLLEARHLLAECSRVFNRFGDEPRYRNARLLLAVILERDGERTAAIDLFKDLLREVKPGDTVFRGRLLHNLGVSLLHDGDSKAETYLQQARHCLISGGLRTEAMRALWNLGRAAKQQARGIAADVLEDAYEEATALGLEIDVAMIALDRAELYLERNEPSLAHDLCRDALETFQKAEAPRFAAEAFAFLERAARTHALTSADLSFVRDFISEAANDPDRRFHPPSN